MTDEMSELDKARTDYEILTSDYEELAYDVLELRERVSKLRAALTAIAELGTLTLLGGRDLDPERAYQHGANSAFGQAAEMARAALIPPSGRAEHE